MLPTLAAPFPAGVTGSFTTRAGGVSTGPWATLNLARHVGDSATDVEANRARLAADLAAPAVVFLDQNHGADVAIVDCCEPGSLRADAVVTSTPGVPVAVLVADCLPVLLADPAAGIVAAAHAGRVGLAAGVLDATLRTMVSLGASPATVVAVVGPAVCGRCYEVPAGLRAEVAAVVPDTAANTRSGSPSLDLLAGAAAVLAAAGVATVQRLESCTMEDPRWFSFRRDGRTGRFAGLIRLDG